MPTTLLLSVKEKWFSKVVKLKSRSSGFHSEPSQCRSGAPPAQHARPSQIRPLLHGGVAPLPVPHSNLQNPGKTLVLPVLPPMATLQITNHKVAIVRFSKPVVPVLHCIAIGLIALK